MPKQDWFEYVDLCGWVLAPRACPARLAIRRGLAGYLGKTGAFDEAIETFAIAYATRPSAINVSFFSKPSARAEFRRAAKGRRFPLPR